MSVPILRIFIFLLLAAFAQGQTVAPTDNCAQTKKENLSAGQFYLKLGDCYLKLKDNAKAIDAYLKSAQYSLQPAKAYFNICAVMYNVGDTARAESACKLAIKFDPNRADAYFVLGSVLFAESPIASYGKVQPLEGTREALNKYLELAPDGPHAEDVKAMLKMLN